MCKFFFIFFSSVKIQRDQDPAYLLRTIVRVQDPKNLTTGSAGYISELFSLVPPRMFPRLARSERIGFFFPNNYSDVFTETGARSGNLPIRVSVHPP